MSVSRRRFLAAGCSAAVAAMAGSRITGISFAAGGAGGVASAGDILVVVFLRGGMDGLALVAPVNDADYVAARGPGLRVAEQGEEAGLPLANAPGEGKLDFRIHPKAAPLKELYDSGRLALIHACGLTNGTRSHFDASALMERGIADAERQARTAGWLARHLAVSNPGGLLPAVAAASAVPDSLAGSSLGVAVPSFDDFNLYGGDAQIAALERLYAGDGPLLRAGREALRAVRTVNGKLPRNDDGNPAEYQPEGGAQYPDGDLGGTLRTVARLIKCDVGLRVATVDYGGWDTHEDQVNQFPGLVEQLSTALAGFYNDLTRYQDRLNVIVMSEFGRRLMASQSDGTDHGHGNVMMALGQNVNGGRIFGRWPGLATEQLDDHADLAVTTDYRTVLGELLVRRLGNPKLSAVLPGLKAYDPLGVFKGADADVEVG